MGSRVMYPLCLLLVLAFVSAEVGRAADPTLVGYWMMDETSGLTAADSSGNGNDGALSGDLTWQPAGGMWAGALLWGGESTAHVEISAAGMSADAGTIMMWANLSEPQPAQTRYLFGHTTQPSYNNRIQLYMDGSNTQLDLGLGSAHAVQGNIRTLDTQTWYHVALTWNAGSYVVYIDGEQAATGTYSGLTTIHDFAWIGNDGNPVSEGVEGFGGLLDEVAIYSRALNLEEVQAVMNGDLRAKTTASEPQPEDGATDVRRDATLQWLAGKYAATHDVYLGTAQVDVEMADRIDPLGVLVSQAQSNAAYDPEGLFEIGQTYYWRVDEVNAAPDNAIYKGDVWSFTAEPMAYPIEEVTATTNAITVEGGVPEHMVDGSGLNADGQHSTQADDMWLGAPGEDPVWLQFEFDRIYKLHELRVWNYNVMFEPVLGFGLKDVTIDYSADGIDWASLGEAQFARATARADYASNTSVDLGGVPARFVRLNVGSGWGQMGQYGLSEVQFLYIPVQAREPEPADGAGEVPPDSTLAWRSGREAVSHAVYFGDDPETLSLAGTAQQASFTPTAMEFGSTYYWRVDEVNDFAEPALWTGDLWSFSTQEYALIDGFETYNDDLEAGTTIFDTWLDGWVNDTGSVVGYIDAPFAERKIVRTGAQSMPLHYDNSVSPFYSETERVFETAQDWTTYGADSVVIYVQGVAPSDDGTDPGNAPEPLYVVVEDSAGNTATAANLDTTLSTTAEWQPWRILFSELVGVNMSRVESVVIGVGSRTSPTAGGTGVLFVDDVSYGRPAEAE